LRKKPSVVVEMPTTVAEFAETVGASIPRTDSRVKACGNAIYVTDIRDLDMLYGKAVRSPYAHALVKKIDSSGALKVPGVVAVYTANDIPGKNLTGARIVRDQPVLAPDWSALPVRQLPSLPPKRKPRLVKGRNV